MSRNTGRNWDKGRGLNHATPQHKSKRASDARAHKGGEPTLCTTAGRAVPSHAANGGIRARAAAATAARFLRNTPRRVAPTDAGIEPGRFFQPTTKENHEQKTIGT